MEDNKTGSMMKITLYIVFGLIVIMGAAAAFVGSDDTSYSTPTQSSSSSSW